MEYMEPAPHSKGGGPTLWKPGAQVKDRQTLGNQAASPVREEGFSPPNLGGEEITFEEQQSNLQYGGGDDLDESMRKYNTDDRGMDECAEEELSLRDDCVQVPAPSMDQSMKTGTEPSLDL